MISNGNLNPHKETNSPGNGQCVLNVKTYYIGKIHKVGIVNMTRGGIKWITKECSVVLKGQKKREKEKVIDTKIENK